ncbi:MAG TPA: STAS domain-containing protein [Candidatus Limnocylindrales bacterium]|jgi:anti-sigma B factor antagonist
MSSDTTTIEVRRLSPAASTIAITGDITSGTEPALMDAYARASNDVTRSILLDFRGLDYMNSGGIGLLVTLLVRVQRQNQHLFAFGLTEHYRQIFELTRLDDAIGIYETEAAALERAVWLDGG